MRTSFYSINLFLFLNNFGVRFVRAMIVVANHFKGPSIIIVPAIVITEKITMYCCHWRELQFRATRMLHSS